MTKNRQFPVTFVLVLLIHLALILLILRTFVFQSDAQTAPLVAALEKPLTVDPADVTWVDTNPALEQIAATPPPKKPKEKLPFSRSVDPDNDPESDIALPVRPPESPSNPEPKPDPIPKLAAVTPPPSNPTPTPAPKTETAPVLAPADAPGPTPKPDPKPALKPAPKPDSKTVPALKPASPPPPPKKPQTKPEPTPVKTPTPAPKPKPTPPQPASPNPEPPPLPSPSSKETSPGSAPSSNPAPTASNAPAVGPPDLGWYHQVIHDAFHKNWRQPQSLPTATNAFQTKAHISIKRDGSIADARIIQASGNEIMDGSVQTAIDSVTKIVPLPNTIPNDTYSVVINFQLD